MILWKCQSCKTTLRTADADAGKTAACPQCHVAIVVPERVDEDESVLQVKKIDWLEAPTAQIETVQKKLVPIPEEEIIAPPAQKAMIDRWGDQLRGSPGTNRLLADSFFLAALIMGVIFLGFVYSCGIWNWR